jgi:hypothetical protein
MGVRRGKINQKINAIIRFITFVDFNDWKKLIYLKKQRSWN